MQEPPRCWVCRTPLTRFTGGTWFCQWCRKLSMSALLLLSACTVYEEPLCGRAHPGGGVVVRVAELADDGGSE